MVKVRAGKQTTEEKIRNKKGEKMRGTADR
jgi:hypothetical protein